MRQRRGFVLVTVLAMLVILSLLAGTVGAITQRLRDEQLERQRLLQAEIDMASTRASVVYLLLTQRMTFGGLTVDDRVVLSEDERADRQPDADQLSFMPVGNEIALDGRPYAGLGQVRFSLQDDRGLLAVNWTAPALLERYLDQAGGGGTPVATQINRLLDYQDEDDLYRLNSFERDGYEREKRPPPSNRTLATPLELRRIKGWDEALASMSDTDLLGSVTTIRSPQININTAPARVLQALPGVDAAAAERVVAQRALQPFLNLAGFNQIVGALPAELELLSLYPSASGTLRLWSAQGGGVQVLHWTLTPLDDGGRPWREDYEFTLPQDGQIATRPAGPTAAKVLAQPPPSAE
jgi:type II secretory pathway component PulK